jgi:hypothetical protein
MPSKNPRINVVFDRPLYDSVKKLAEKEKNSLSAEVQFLVREAMELYEDTGLVGFAESREKSLKGRKLLSHKQVWGK